MLVVIAFLGLFSLVDAQANACPSHSHEICNSPLGVACWSRELVASKSAQGDCTIISTKPDCKADEVACEDSSGHYACTNTRRLTWIKLDGLTKRITCLEKNCSGFHLKCSGNCVAIEKIKKMEASGSCRDKDSESGLGVILYILISIGVLFLIIVGACIGKCLWNWYRTPAEAEPLEMMDMNCIN